MSYSSSSQSQPGSARSSDSEGSSRSEGSSDSLSDKENRMLSNLFLGRDATSYNPRSLTKGTEKKPFKLGGKKSRRKPKKKKRTIRRRTRQ
jgi:hypothetical protein